MFNSFVRRLLAAGVSPTRIERAIREMKWDGFDQATIDEKIQAMADHLEEEEKLEKDEPPPPIAPTEETAPTEPGRATSWRRG